jgi:error-prone DNA polymerase
VASSLPSYAELHCLSCFSFLRGASHPDELIGRAKALGYSALAITDDCSLAGIVRAHVAAKAAGMKLLCGAEFSLVDGLKLVLLAQDRAGYGNLSALITLARRRSGKGVYRLTRGDLEALAPAGAVPGCLCLWLAGGSEETKVMDGRWLASNFPGRCWLAVELHAGPNDAELLVRQLTLARQCGLPAVAAGDAHMHLRARRPLQDVMTAVRLNTTVFDAGHALYPNGERHLRTRLRLARVYPSVLLAETLKIAACCQFSLDELHYEYPDEIVPHGELPAAYLAREVEAGLVRRYPQGVPLSVRGQIERELVLIAELQYEAYFLTVYDIVNFARGQKILCQGRGSAANSAVCYALDITEVDPARSNLLFERFISRERGEPPDIDVDFEHERREEVVQYIYAKYGRERAALAAALITYRTRGALRDVGRALGFSTAQIDVLSGSLAWWDKRDQLPARCAGVGLDPESPRVAKWLALTEMLIGFPRHLSQHVGGFIISRGPLARLVPIENAAMENRTVIQWDKNDIEALGLLKVDVLALGMLSATRRALALLGMEMQDIPSEDPAVYDMICRADTIGVFQIESRAQMAMLPRLKPRRFYDLVVQVAIVRPGPIQGDMVHPYLKRRERFGASGQPLRFSRPELEDVLGRTYGVPIFQEQAMQLAVVAAGFTPGEADQLRRAMGAWQRKGGLTHLREKLLSGMADRGYPTELAERLYRQIEGFGDYGFPESHAASFALLAYVSAWLKCHHPAEFLCALLNSQPMGFYSPSQLVQDARRHGVTVLPVDVQVSAEAATIETGSVRLGLQGINGLSQVGAAAVVVKRPTGGYAGMSDLAARAGITQHDLDTLARAGALKGLAGHRRQAAWKAAGAAVQLDLLATAVPQEALPELAAPSEAEDLVADYASTGLTLGRHPLGLLRKRLTTRRFLSAGQLAELPDRALARMAGIVTCRQRPGTASGVVFVTLEDETGLANIVIYGRLADRQRRELLGSSLLGVLGQVQREGEVVHLVAGRLVDLSAWLGRLETVSRDFH